MSPVSAFRRIIPVEGSAAWNTADPNTSVGISSGSLLLLFGSAVRRARYSPTFKSFSRAQGVHMVMAGVDLIYGGDPGRGVRK